ncbi:hypothetical protein PV10_06508 [Exophiala mesophila]|uniref:BZIP domain-containing protein n=1 Tax=Exophiala mesophila TaxID=212818 RepID=A0A0D1WSA7_EXOME|nr:uncharacterized protein PV10_06508 [Exophiala mesophila]KIV92030.1 hypothetical protein PV10_06508 [Exophiala mesophila]
MSLQTTDDFFLPPDQQDLLIAALNSNKPLNNKSGSNTAKTTPQPSLFTPNMSSAPDSGHLDFSDESPFLDFDPEGDFDDSFTFDGSSRMIGDIPGDLHDKRKSIGGDDDDEEEGGGKRREGEDKTAKKPGRKPLTSEPTTKRKAQNRAAQRAFRERKEKHLKDLETKVEDLEKSSESANHENGLLRAQVERLQVELKEYRKRLSWVSSNGLNRSQFSPQNQNRLSSVNGQNDFQFEFPKFGDLPSLQGANKLNDTKDPSRQKSNGNLQGSNSSSPAAPALQNANATRSNSTTSQRNSSARLGSVSQSPVMNNNISASPSPMNRQNNSGSVDSLTGLFSPSVLEASRHASLGNYFPQSAQPGFNNVSQPARTILDGNTTSRVTGVYSNSTASTSDSPGSSAESHNAISSIGTSPEPSLNSPANKLTEFNLNPISEENQYNFGGKEHLCREISQACGCIDDPIPPMWKMSNAIPSGFNADGGLDGNGFNWLAQQNNNTFDPILFGDYRETQDNILSQDFGSFFNDAYPLPDLGSPLHNYNDVTTETPFKNDLIKQVDLAKDSEQVVPDTDKPMSCNKIWDRLQSMEKFRNGEIDIDNLCSELRAKAKCSEGGAVVDKKDVDKILGSTR